MQFRLSTLLLLAVVLWSSLALFGALFGVLNCAMVVVLALCLARGPLPKSLEWFFLLLVTYFGLALLLTPPPPQMGVTYARREICQHHLKTIALALHNYQRENRCFPPAYIADKRGHPMHSWRVLILPYIDDSAAKLYQQYKFDEPWDGPNNKKLLAACPKWYICPTAQFSRSRTPAETNYVAVVGVNTAWPGEKPRDAVRPDLAESTISVVEVVNSNIPWTAPRDFNIDALSSPSQPISPSRKHTTAARPGERVGAYAAMADGSVLYLSGQLLDSDKAPSLYKVGGCPKTHLLGDPFTAHQPNPWTTFTALLIWLASVSLLLFRAVKSRRKLAPTDASKTTGQGPTSQPTDTVR